MIVAIASVEGLPGIRDLFFCAHDCDENMAVFDIWLLRTMTG